MLKQLLVATLLALPFVFIPPRAAGQQPAPASEDTKARLNKKEIIDLMISVGRMSQKEQDSKADLIWKDPSGSKTPRSDFMFCAGLAYLGNFKAQACLGNAFEKGLGIVEDLFEAYAWYALALEGSITDKTAEQQVQADKERVIQKLRSSYPAPNDDDLDDMVKTQMNRITQYREEMEKAAK